MTRPSALVVHAHPSRDSYNHRLAGIGVEALEQSHEVTLLDLHRSAFDPVMDVDGLDAYRRGDPVSEPLLRSHTELVRRAETLVFVYPTWWMGLPAILKGWLERVLVPGIAFELDDRRRVRPALHSVRRIVGITTYGSPRWRMVLVGDGGRRIIHRALRMTVPHRVERIWLGLWDTDNSTPSEREDFADRVRRRLESL